LREKKNVLRGSDTDEGNAFVDKLKAQTEDNKEKNRLDVARKTFENDQVSAEFRVLCVARVLYYDRTEGHVKIHSIQCV
jgi:hypothetical protein